MKEPEMNAVMRIILKKYHPEKYQALLDEEAAEQEERIRLLKSKYEQEVREERKRKKAEEMSLSELVEHLNDNKPSSLTKSKRQWIQLSSNRVLK